MFIRITLFLTTLLFISCGKNERDSSNDDFYKLTAYFKSETDSLQKSGSSLEKIITHGDSSETVILKSPDWKEELKPFFDIVNIKPARRSSFTIKKDADVLSCIAIDEHSPLRLLRIHYSGNTPDTITAISSVSNFYYSANDTLEYFGRGNYHISTSNKPVLGKEIRFEMGGRVVVSSR